MAIQPLSSVEVAQVSGGFLDVNLGLNNVRLLGGLFDAVRGLLKGLASGLAPALAGVPLVGTLLGLLGSEPASVV